MKLRCHHNYIRHVVYRSTILNELIMMKHKRFLFAVMSGSWCPGCPPGLHSGQVRLYEARGQFRCCCHSLPKCFTEFIEVSKPVAYKLPRDLTRDATASSS